MRAVVYAYGDTDAEGPDRTSGERRSGWSVSFRIWAPRATALALSAKNGSITVRSMRGESRFTLGSSGPLLELRTVNGGVRINAR